MSEDHMDAEASIHVKLARQEEKFDGLKQTVEREFSRMADAVAKHSEAVTAAFKSMEERFVSKAENIATTNRIDRLEKIVYGTVGVVLLAFVYAWTQGIIKP